MLINNNLWLNCVRSNWKKDTKNHIFWKLVGNTKKYYLYNTI